MHSNELGLKEEDVEITLKVLGKFRDAAQNQIEKIAEKIKHIEKILEQPYIKHK